MDYPDLNLKRSNTYFNFNDLSLLHRNNTPISMRPRAGSTSSIFHKASTRIPLRVHLPYARDVVPLLQYQDPTCVWLESLISPFVLRLSSCIMKLFL